MGNLKRNYNRFIYKNRNKGIPNLMTWICGINAVGLIFYYLFQFPVTDYFSMSPAHIMQGQFWRLFTYIFSFACEQSFLGSGLLGGILSIYLYFWIGKVLESAWGTLRFNMFYFSGILIQNLYTMLVFWIFDIPGVYGAHCLNMAMFLAVATLLPDQKVLLFMIIPIKMKWSAWISLGFTFYSIAEGIYKVVISISSVAPQRLTMGIILMILYPLAALLNYLLFFGRDASALLPDGLKRKHRKPRRSVYSQEQPNPDWAKNYRNSKGERPYRHKCTVCGRTDTDCPDLEFRYCSKCTGYFCYCIDHINNHDHVQ